MQKPSPVASSSQSPAQGVGTCDAYDSPAVPALLATLFILGRQRRGLLRAEKTTSLSAQAICRTFTGSKEEGAKLYAAIKKGSPHDPFVGSLVADWIAAGAELRTRRKARERQMAALVAKLPVWSAWAVHVRGLGAVGFGLLVGEASTVLQLPLGKAGASKLWTRFGVGCFVDGTRHRLIAGENTGYAPWRRALLWTIGDAMLKQGREYRARYDKHKAALRARVPEGEEGMKAHIHADAKRRMEKDLVADIWGAWRAWRRGELDEWAQTWMAEPERVKAREAVAEDGGVEG